MQHFDISHSFKFYKCSRLKRILRQHLERKTICVVWTSAYFKKCMNRKRKRCNSPIGAVIVKALRGAVAGFCIFSSMPLETPKRGSYPLLELLLLQEAPARSSRRFLYLLVVTS